MSKLGVGTRQEIEDPAANPLVRSSQFWSGMVPMVLIGFLFGTYISTVTWSSAWPLDALIVSVLFALIGALIGFIGWRNNVHALIPAVTAPLTAFVSLLLTFFVSTHPRVDQWLPIGYAGGAIVLLLWIVLSWLLGLLFMQILGTLETLLRHQ